MLCNTKVDKCIQRDYTRVTKGKRTSMTYKNWTYTIGSDPKYPGYSCVFLVNSKTGERKEIMSILTGPKLDELVRVLIDLEETKREVFRKDETK